MRNMKLLIRGVTDCVMHSVIHYLTVKNEICAAVHRRLCEMLGENVMSEQKVRKWCSLFLKVWRNAIKSNRFALLSKGVILLHDDTCVHSAAQMTTL